MKYTWGDLISLEYGKPVSDKDTLNGSVPVYGTNGQIGSSNLPPLCLHPSFVLGRKGAYRGVHYSDKPFSVIDTAFFAMSKTPDLDLKWAYYKFLTYDINRMDSGSAIPSTDRYEIYSMPIELPCLEQQRAAVSILEKMDEKIALNSNINHHLEQMAQATFEWLLVEESADEPIGLLSDIAEINPFRPLNRGQDAVYIEMANLPTRSSFPTDWTMRPFSGGMKFANGDTIMARITPCLENGKTAYINFLEEGTVAFGSTEYIVITAKSGYCNEMFYFLARYPDFVSYAVRNMNGSSGRQRVSSDTIGRYELHIPSSGSVREFSEMAAPIMESIRQNALESRNLATLRDSLLPRLMSGELSVAELGSAK